MLNGLSILYAAQIKLDGHLSLAKGRSTAPCPDSSRARSRLGSKLSQIEAKPRHQITVLRGFTTFQQVKSIEIEAKCLSIDYVRISGIFLQGNRT